MSPAPVAVPLGLSDEYAPQSSATEKLLSPMDFLQISTNTNCRGSRPFQAICTRAVDCSAVTETGFGVTFTEVSAETVLTPTKTTATQTDTPDNQEPTLLNLLTLTATLHS
jgi:hypothetical protein